MENETLFRSFVYCIYSKYRKIPKHFFHNPV